VGAELPRQSLSRLSRLLDDKNVDVVIYATPEHWHYLPCIHACQAGKHIYGEQPLGHTIREGRKMIEAVRKYKRVFQTGEQQRSHPASRKAVELIRNGRIGKIQSIIGYNYPSPYECNFPAQPIRRAWTGTPGAGRTRSCPTTPTCTCSRVPYEREPPYYTPSPEQYAVGPGWMSFRPYSGGELLNWGCHGLSMVHWALDMDHSGPVEIWVEPEEKLPTVVYDLPDTRDRGDAACAHPVIHYRYANGVVLSLTSIDPKVGGGATFIGDKGRITIFRDGYECDPVGLDEDPLPADAVRVYESDNHMENFFECVVSGKDPIMTVEAGHSVAALCHLGNIARWLGRRLKWDPEKEIFPDDEEANQYLDVPKRKPYELPTKCRKSTTMTWRSLTAALLAAYVLGLASGPAADESTPQTSARRPDHRSSTSRWMHRKACRQAVIVQNAPLVHTRQLLPLDSAGQLVARTRWTSRSSRY
jgi:predicted dehydrogenase